MAGVGPLEIPLEEEYRAKDWTIQLRWPVSMNDVECFSDKIVEMDCGGKGRILKTKTVDWTQKSGRYHGFNSHYGSLSKMASSYGDC